MRGDDANKGSLFSYIDLEKRVRSDHPLRLIRECGSAWNKDPVFGVIGIQSGPRGGGSTVASMILGSRGWDADFGIDCKDPSRIFCTGQVDQIDLP